MQVLEGVFDYCMVKTDKDTNAPNNLCKNKAALLSLQRGGFELCGKGGDDEAAEGGINLVRS